MCKIFTKIRAALEVGTLDCCVFLDKTPFLFKKALDAVSRKWKGRPKHSRIKLESRVSKDKIKSMTCDWNFILNCPDVVIEDVEDIDIE